MTPSVAVSLVACAGQLGLALVAGLRVARSPVALPLALLCVDLFTWNFAALAHGVWGDPGWRWLDTAASPLTAPLALHVVVNFTGRRRRLGWLLAAAYAAFGALSALSALAFASAWARAFAGSAAWAAAHLALALPALALATALIAVHLARAGAADEQARARLMLLALVVGAVVASTDLWADLGFDVPRFGNLGSLGSTAIMAAAALRFRLLERQVTSMALVYSVALAALGVLAYLAVFRAFGANLGVLALATGTVTLALFAAARQSLAQAAAHRERLGYLATLGRFSAQMAHDLRNPLAALRGAVQYLQGEWSQGRTGPEQREFLELLVDQVDRVHAVVDRYQRLGRIDPSRAPVAVNDLVRGVLALEPFAAAPSVSIRGELADGLPACAIDRDLIAGAVENLVRNALEAMPGGGQVTVRTARSDGAGDGVSVRVEDTGVGMDARTRERAFDDFFTTKATGSGMGLSFVRRIVEAHGGTVTLDTAPGRGTAVTVVLPVAAGGPGAA